MTIYKAILNLKAIQMARISAAQDDPSTPLVVIDEEANEALEMAIKELEKRMMEL